MIDPCVKRLEIIANISFGTKLYKSKEEKSIKVRRVVMMITGFIKFSFQHRGELNTLCKIQAQLGAIQNMERFYRTCCNRAVVIRKS